MKYLIQSEHVQIPWNKGKLIGQKSPLKLKEIWAIRIRLQLSNHIRDLALFNLAIDSKLRSCDLIKIRVMDIAHGATVMSRAIVMQQKVSVHSRPFYSHRSESDKFSTTKHHPVEYSHASRYTRSSQPSISPKNRITVAIAL